MAVKEKTHAPESARSESTKAAKIVTPRLTLPRVNKVVNKPAEVGQAATSVQRARASASMQQRLGNARVAQMTGVAPPAPATPTQAPVTVKPARATVVSTVPIVSTTIKLPLMPTKPAVEKETKATAPVPKATPQEEPVAAPGAAKDTAPPVVAGAPEPPATEQVAGEKAAGETAAKGDKDSKPATEAGEAKASAATGEKKPGGEGEGKLPEEPGSTGAAPVVVKLHMPEPPSEMSPATKRRIGGVKKRAGGAAKAHGDLPDGSQQVGDARQAVDEPDAEAIAKAQADLINQVQAAPSPEIVKLCERIRQVIRDKRPPDEDALVEADPEAAAKEAGNTLNATVEGETKKVQDNYVDMNAQPAATPAQGGDLPPQPGTAETAPVNATAATPDAVPAENVSLDADVAANQQKMQDAGMEKPTAQLAQSGPVAEARDAQGELEQTAKEDPAKVLASQQEALGKAEGDMAALQAQALAALNASRKGTAKKATSSQEGMVGSEESMRTQASAEAKTIFEDTQKQVSVLLQPLAANAITEWEAAKTIYVSKFKSELAVVKERVDERHSGVGGFFLGLKDRVAGLPDWATDAYNSAESNFAESVIAKLTEISIEVNSIIATCDQLIKTARERIAKIFKDLPESLQTWASGEQAKFDQQLNKLQDQVTSTQANFNKDLTGRASAAVDEVRAEIADLRKKAGGIIGRIANAISRFLDDPVKFIIEALLDLLGIPPATFWAVVKKIKKAIADIADDPEKFANNLFEGLGKGFSQFFDNFGTHMINGFVEWLTGGLASAGVHLPKDFSLKSVMTFFLELMGITWPRIRKILAKHVGEKNVALLEKVYSLLSILIEKGPEGIFEMIKEKLDPQMIVDKIIDMAVDYMITAIIKAATARIIMLFNPVGAILQAIEAIYKVLKWVFQNAAKIFSLIETIVDGIADIIAGSISGFANAVEKALAKLIAPVIAFIADYLGFGDLPDKIAETVKSFQDWILGLIDQALGWLIEKGKALLAAVGIGKKEDKKDKKDDIDEGIGEKIEFSADGHPHSLWIEATGGGIVAMVKSDTMSVQQLLDQFREKLKGQKSKNATSARALIAKAEAKLTEVDETAKVEHQADQKAETTPEDPAANKSAVDAQHKTAAKEESLAELLSQIFELVHGGDNVLGLLDKHIINRGKGKKPDKIKDSDAVNAMTAAKYVVYSQEKLGRDRYYVRREEVPEDESEAPQVHFTDRTETEEGGKLNLGPAGATNKATDEEKIGVYNILLDLVSLKELDEEEFDTADKYREEARDRIIKKLVKTGAPGLLKFMEESKVIPPSYNRLRGDIYDEWMIESGTRTYRRPGPLFEKANFPGIRRDRQPDGSRGTRLYEAKGHQGVGPSGDEKLQYEDYLLIIASGKTGYKAIVYVILDPDAREKWESEFGDAMFAP